MKPRAESQPPWRWALAGAAALSAALLSRYGVGTANDDAEYVLAARSLAQGGLIEKLLNNHLLHDRLPGFPLLLAPFAAHASSPFDALKAVPFALTVLAGVLLWHLLRPWLKPWPRFAVLVLYAFNPLVLEYSGRVMTEPLFAALALGSFLLLRRVLASNGAGSSVLLGLLLGWAAIVRGEGLALAAGAALGLWVGGRRRRILPVLAAAFAVAGTVFIGNSLAHRTPTPYLQVWTGAAGGVSWLAHLARLARVFAWNSVLGMPRFASSGAALALAAVLALALLAAAAAGARRLDRLAGPERGVVWAAFSFSALYLLIHALWPVADPRFFIAVLPYLLASVAAAAEEWGAPRAWPAAALAAVLISYGANAAQAVRAGRDAVPAAAFAWIETNLPRDARVWAFYDWTMLELHTGRTGAFFPIPADPDAFRDRLLTERADFVFLAPFRDAMEPVAGLETVAGRRRRLEDWISDRRAYEPVYRNGEERAAIYRVLPAERFHRAYAAYLTARDRLARGDWDGGFTALDEALKIEPDLVPALNAYGATCAITGRRLALGRRRLEEALRLRPGDPLARANLGRLPAARGSSREEF